MSASYGTHNVVNQATSEASDGSDAKDRDSLSAAMVFYSLGLFVLAGFAEIGGGWLVWKYVREGKPWFWMVLGSITLIFYGFINTLQPSEAIDSFGRVNAIYGGFFIVMAAMWGWVFDGDRPDIGDLVGGIIALAGVMTIYFWPRED